MAGDLMPNQYRVKCMLRDHGPLTVPEMVARCPRHPFALHKAACELVTLGLAEILNAVREPDLQVFRLKP